jgi:hypothetical protein
MNKARRIAEYEALGFEHDEAVTEALLDAYNARWDRRARRRLARAWHWTLIGPFVRQEWAQIAWVTFIAALFLVHFEPAAVWIIWSASLVYEHRIFRGQRRLKNAVANLERERDRLKRHNRTLAGAVESAAEFIVEQRMEFEGHPLGPVVWIDGQAYPVDDEQSVAYDNDKE